MQEIYTDDIGSGFPLILVHGYLGSSEMWKFQKDYLCKNFRVISPALPGFGESHKAKSFNFDLPFILLLNLITGLIFFGASSSLLSLHFLS